MPPFERITLSNGLTVLLDENHARPLVTFDYWVRAGSADEPTSFSGASHFLEHILFKGTAKHGPAEIDRIIEGIGGVWNAGTSQDFTHFHINVASDFATTAAEMLNEIITSARIDPDEVDRERRVIVEEFQRKQDSPGGLLYDETNAAAFESGPYKNPVLGTPESLAGIGAEALREYYDRHYAPANCVLAVAGDVTKESLLAMLERTFAQDARVGRPMLAAPPPLRRAEAIKRAIPKNVRETYLTLVLPAPSIAELKDVYAMEVLSSIMGDGRTARLYCRLKDKDRLVTTIGAGFSTQRFPSLFRVSATLDGANLDAARAAIDDEIGKIAGQAKIARRVTAAELKRAKRQIRAGILYATETNAGRASMAGYYYTISGSEIFLQTYLDEIEKVTAQDVTDVARKYLDPYKAVQVIVTPKNAAEKP